MTIYYVRHGQTVWNRARRLQGRKDSPLTLRGVELAIAYGRWLGQRLTADVDLAFYASPLGRTRQTATLIADTIGFDPEHIELDPLLVELDVGDFEGLQWDEIERERGIPRERWQDWQFRGHGGETRVDVLERAQQWLDVQRPNQAVIVVSHGGFSRAIRAAYLGLGPEDASQLETHKHGRLYTLENGRCNEHIVDSATPAPEAPVG